MYSEQVNKQFPIRLGFILQTELDRVSKETHINKSTLIRLAVENLIKEIDELGVGQSMKSLSRE